ncbi:MAG: hypothetical protein HY644_08875 [Acidobacteria bacterium]|nr:hypothetical protein [Acidobacteriota bacterium]
MAIAITVQRPGRFIDIRYWAFQVGNLGLGLVEGLDLDSPPPCWGDFEMRSYRVRVAGKIFEDADPKILIKRAVAAKKSRHCGESCKNCGNNITELELAGFGYCIVCIERAISIFQSRRRVAV